MTSFRVAQWATGNIGTRSLRAVIEHPAMELVGVYTYSDQKKGLDAGELCGAARTGVEATGDIERILVARPDCVLYMGDRPDLDVICELLGSGANVVTTRGEFHRPASMDPETRARVEEACLRGRTSIHSTGSSPGFITEALPLVLLSIQRRLDGLYIDEFADMSSRDSPELLFTLMGFASSPEDFQPEGRAAYLKAAFGPSLALVADAVGLPLDDLQAASSVAVARRDVEVVAGRVPAGSVAGQRTEVRGLHRGRTLTRFRATWYLTEDLEPAWDLAPTGWAVLVDGDAPLDVRISFPVAPEDWPAVSPGLTAHRAVNAVPAVCAAPPGIVTTLNLPHIAPDLSASAS